MANYIQRFIRLVLLVVCCSLLPTSWGIAQDKPQTGANSSASQLGDDTPKTFVEEIQPGITVLGLASRFAEVGTTSSFDSSPEGSRLVFASAGKIKFFDLLENKVTDTIGDNKENYQHVRYSPDGRYVFAVGQRNGKAIVRVYDAIDLTSVGTITSKVEAEDEDEKNNRYFHLNSLLVSPDATYVGLCSHDSIQVRDVKSGELVYHAKNLGYVLAACFSPDEKYFIYPKNNTLDVVEIESGKKQTQADFPVAEQRSYSVSSNIATNSLAVPSSSSVSIFKMGEDAAEPITINFPANHHGQSQATIFSDDGKMLTTSVWTDGQIKLLIIDVEKQKVARTISVGASGHPNCRFSSDNQLLFVSGHGISGVKEISIAKDSQLTDSKHPSGPAASLIMHPDEDAFLTVTSGGEISWFNIATGDVNRSMVGSNISSVDFNDTGSEILVASQWNANKGIATYHFETGKQKQNYSMPKTAKSESLFSQFGRFMGGTKETPHRQQYSIAASYSADATKIVSLGMVIEQILEPQSEGLFSSSYTSHQQKHFLAAFEFDTAKGRQKSSKPIPTEKFGFGEHDWPSVAATNPHGNQFAVANQAKLFLVDTNADDPVSELELGDDADSNAGQIRKIRYSPDGRLLAVRGNKGISIVDVENGKVVHVSSKSRWFAFSQDGKRLAVAGANKKSKIEILNTESWKPVFNRKETQGDRTSISLSPNGQKVLIGLRDCRVELWDLQRFIK